MPSHRGRLAAVATAKQSKHMHAVASRAGQGLTNLDSLHSIRISTGLGGL